MPAETHYKVLCSTSYRTRPDIELEVWAETVETAREAAAALELDHDLFTVQGYFRPDGRYHESKLLVTEQIDMDLNKKIVATVRRVVARPNRNKNVRRQKLQDLGILSELPEAMPPTETDT